MPNPEPLKIYLCFGDDSQTCFFCNDGATYIMPESLETVAKERGYHIFINPDGSGFALDFKNVDSVHMLYAGWNADLGKPTVIIPTLDEATLSRSRTIGFTNLTNDGSAVMFNNGCIIFLPITPDQVETLRTSPIDARAMMRPHGDRPAKDLRL